jgi:glycosyltransferase involved in cell wall biosynthesis
MWAFCGAEHYIDFNSPERYKEGYCSFNRSSLDVGLFDIDKWVWRRKKKNWSNVKFNFVTPSKWITDCLQESKLFSDQKAVIIPNCLDTEMFQPKKKEICRKIFDIDQGKKIILFGADEGGKNPLKGFHLLQDSFKILASSKLLNEIQCVVFGGCNNLEQEETYGIPIKNVGRITDDELLASLYNAVDLFVIPSMIDNLPNTVMEAMSCGVPCIGFNIGGIPDLIDHQENGFLVPPFSSKGLSDGMQWLVSDMNRLTIFGRNARKKVLANYHPNIIAKQYTALYQQVLSDYGK